MFTLHNRHYTLLRKGKTRNTHGLKWRDTPTHNIGDSFNNRNLYSDSMGPKGTYAGASNPTARKKMNPQTAGTRDRGYTNGKPAKPVARPQPAGAKVAKPAARPQNVSRPATSKAPMKKPSAFQGSRNSGKSERAASNRGRASMAKGGRPANRGNSGQQRGNRR